MIQGPITIQTEKEWIEELKDESPYFPLAIWKERDNNIWISTIVRILRNDEWWKVHCLQRYDPNPLGIFKDEGMVSVDAKAFYMLSQTVYNIIHLYKLSGIEEKDSIQITEEDRIRGGLNWIIGQETQIT